MRGRSCQNERQATTWRDVGGETWPIPRGTPYNSTSCRTKNAVFKGMSRLACFHFLPLSTLCGSSHNPAKAPNNKGDEGQGERGRDIRLCRYWASDDGAANCIGCGGSVWQNGGATYQLCRYWASDDGAANCIGQCKLQEKKTKQNGVDDDRGRWPD
jgi:hypothetical protein